MMKIDFTLVVFLVGLSPDVCAGSSSCGYPPTIENGFPIPSRNERMELDHGTRLMYKCRYNLTLMERGTVVCHFGVWVGDLPECVGSCNTNDLQYYDGLIVPKNMVYNHSETLDIHCLEGYIVSSPEVSVICQNGKWKVSDNPCNEARCYTYELTVYEGLKVPEEETLFNFESIEIECIKGYDALTPGGYITCLNGKWSVQQDPCKERIECERPLTPEYGSVKLSDDLKVGTLAIYSCDVDKMLHGASTAKCQISGEWTHPPPKCLSFCYILDVEHGEIGKFQSRSVSGWRTYKEFEKLSTGKRVEHNEEVFLRCREGFLPVENATIYENRLLDVKCNDGIWSKDLQCIGTPCNLNEINYPGLILPSWEFLLSGDVFDVVCESDFKPSSPRRKITCFRGEWDITESPCMEAPCNTSEINYPGLFIPTEEFLLSGDAFNIVCENGFRESTSIRNILCFRGEWNIKENPCKEASCNMSEINYPGLIIPSRDILLSGDDFDIVCENGFSELTSRSKITCFRGEWDVTENPCIEARCDTIYLKDFEGLKVPQERFVQDLEYFDIECEKGYEVSIGGEITCLDGKWLVPEDLCTKTSGACIIPEVPNGYIKEKFRSGYARKSYRAVFAGEAVLNGVSLTLFCESGFIVKGKNSRRENFNCSDGRFSLHPKCVEDIDICYLTRNEFSHMMIRPEKEFYSRGEQVSFLCPPGERLSSSVQNVMCVGKTWSNPIPDCIIKED